jgi:hypothetical protein
MELAEQLIVSAMPVFDRIPRSHRYRYGSAVEQSFYDLPNLIIQATTAKTKTKVYALHDHIEYMHSLLRIGAERKLISRRWLGHIIKPQEIGIDQGGVLRQISAMVATWRLSIKESCK